MSVEKWKKKIWWQMVTATSKIETVSNLVLQQTDDKEYISYKFRLSEYFFIMIHKIRYGRLDMGIYFQQFCRWKNESYLKIKPIAFNNFYYFCFEQFDDARLPCFHYFLWKLFYLKNNFRNKSASQNGGKKTMEICDVNVDFSLVDIDRENT